MDFLEFEAKNLLDRYGVTVPPSEFLGEKESSSRAWDGNVAVKAQVTFGGRGKAGLIKLGEANNVSAMVNEVRGKLKDRGLSPLVMVEEQKSGEEYYLCLRVDDIRQAPELLFSIRGGVDIEAHPETVRRFPIEPIGELYPHRLIAFFRDSGARSEVIGALARLAARLYKLFVSEDAELVEINPLLVQSDRTLVALDAKITVDDSAVFRHPEWERTISAKMQAGAMSQRERDAAEVGLTYVEFEGNVAVLTGGAGLGMLVLDAVAEAGFKPANFIDISGGKGAHVFQRQVDIVFELARAPEIEAIVSFLTIASTPVAFIIDAITKQPPPKPMIVGLLTGAAAEASMTMQQAIEKLGRHGIPCVGDLFELTETLSAWSAARKRGEPLPRPGAK